MRSVLKEFRDFVNKGNLVSIATGLVLALAFTRLVTSLVEDVLMPIVAIPFGEPSFDQALVLTVRDSQIRFGALLTSAVSFLVVAAVLFGLLKAYNKVSRGSVTAPAQDIVLLTAIRDELTAIRSQSRKL